MQSSLDVIARRRATWDAAGLDAAQHLPVVLLVGGCLNGLAARLIETLSSTNGFSLFLGISPFDLLAIGVGANLMWSSPLRARLGVLEACVLAALLIPFSTLAWLATATYAAYQIAQQRDGARTGARLFLGLAATTLWSDIGLKWLAIPITSLEAHAVGALIGLLRDDIVQAGNVVGQADGHTLIILTACSSLSGLPKVALGIAAVAAFMGGIDHRRLLVSLAAATFIYIGVNDIRLVLMAWSADLYTIVHGATGANLFDLFQTVLALALGLEATRR